MKIGKTLFKITKYILTGILTFGVIISVGLLAFVGMLLISPLLIYAILAFFLAGSIEGQVYKENILLGIEQLKLLGNKGTEILLIKKLDELVTAQPEYCGFAKDYYRQKELIAGFKGKKLTSEQKKEKQEAKKKLRTMEKFFVEQVQAHQRQSQTEAINPEIFKRDPKFNGLIEQATRALPGIENKLRLLRASFLLIVPASIGAGFATANALKITLLALSLKFVFVLSATALSATLWPLVAIAAIGYGFLIYHSIADMVCDETLKKKWQSFKQWLEPRPGESSLKRGFRVAGVVILVTLALTLAVFATVATAGTWWFAAKKGILLLPHITRAASYIRTVLVPAAGVTQLIFNVKNSIQTAKLIIKHGKLSRPFKAIKEKFKSCRAKENWGQIVNPFRILTNLIYMPLKIGVFSGHLAATGVTSDGFTKINKYLMATINATAEGAEDGAYVFTDKESDHDHGNLVDWGLKIVLSPLFLLSAAWNCVASQCNDGETKKKLSFKEAVKQSFGIEEKPKYEAPQQAKNQQTEHQHDTPSTSSKPTADQQDNGYDWGKIRRERLISKEIKRLRGCFFNTKLAKEKIAIFEKLAKNSSYQLNPQKEKTLAKHRIGFFGVARSAEKFLKCQDIKDESPKLIATM